MTTKYIIASFLAAMIFVSCKKELMPQDSSPTPKDSITEAAAVASAPVPGSVNAAAGMPQMQQNQQMNMIPAPPVTAKGMNPPHGQPGHRCDIAVGAPLNSAPTNSNAQATAQSNQGKMTVTPAGNKMVAPPPVVTAPGMNPPHGQPGHRCDIAVGQPLNSAPPTPAAAATPATAPAILSAPEPTTTTPQ